MHLLGNSTLHAWLGLVGDSAEVPCSVHAAMSSLGSRTSNAALDLTQQEMLKVPGLVLLSQGQSLVRGPGTDSALMSVSRSCGRLWSFRNSTPKGCPKPRLSSCLLFDVSMGVGDAAMGMVVSHLVFASSNCADCETLHDRRKVMVTLCAAKPLRTGETKLPHILACRLCSCSKGVERQFQSWL